MTSVTLGSWSRARVGDIAHGGAFFVDAENGSRIGAALQVAPGDVIDCAAREGSEHLDVLRTHAQSPLRVTPECALVESCGGCSLMHIAASSRREMLVGMVERRVRRAPDEIVVASGNVGYRSRARLAFVGRQVLGYRGRRSNEIIDVDRCVVLSGALSQGLEYARNVLLPLLRGRGELLLAAHDDQPVLGVELESPQSGEVYRELEHAVGSGRIFGATLATQGAQGKWGAPLERFRHWDGQTFVTRLGGFSQANHETNAALVERVALATQRSGARSCLELYSGAGNFSVAVAPRVESLTTVESESTAVDDARENARVRGLTNITMRVADADAQLEDAATAATTAKLARKSDRKGKKERFDLLVLDPPRKGCVGVSKIAADARVSSIAYVSCDVGTFARDARALETSGYGLESLAVFDMFPGTHHVELLGCFKRR